MKVDNILTIVNLKEPQKPTEFAFQEKLVNKDLPMLKTEHHFPGLPAMPTENPNFSRDPNALDTSKFLQNMRVGDTEYLKYAYQLAIEHDIKKTVERRMDRQERVEKEAMGDVLDSETVSIERRTFATWRQRLYMAKLFRSLRIESMEDFKRLSHDFVVQHDRAAQIQYKLFLRQNGDDPAHLPPKMQWDRMNGTVFELARQAAELVSKDLKVVADMQHRLAEQQASLSFQREATESRNLSNWQKDLEVVSQTNNTYFKSKKIS